MSGLRLYIRYIAVSLRSQMQYRGSFIMLVLSQFVVSTGEILGVWALFRRFRTLQGWSLAEVAMLWGIVNVTFAIADAVARGFDVFPNMVKSGDFDRLLLRPRSTALQVTGQELTLFRVGRLVQGLIVFGWAASALNVQWSAARVLVAVGAVAGGVCMFWGIWILQATMAFWTVETLEIMNTITYGGCETAQYPLSIYRRWFRKFFTFVVPLACVSYYPAMCILGRQSQALPGWSWFAWVSPCVGLVFLLVCLQVWKFGVRHYRSTGS